MFYIISILAGLHYIHSYLLRKNAETYLPTTGASLNNRRRGKSKNENIYLAHKNTYLGRYMIKKTH